MHGALESVGSRRACKHPSRAPSSRRPRLYFERATFFLWGLTTFARRGVNATARVTAGPVVAPSADLGVSVKTFVDDERRRRTSSDVGSLNRRSLPPGRTEELPRVCEPIVAVTEPSALE